MENTTLMGARLIDGLEALKDKYNFIGDVRGKGLLLAFEFVADCETMEPLPAEKNAQFKFVNLAYQKGLIIYSRRTRMGNMGDHFLVCPPMIINSDQVDDILSILDDCLALYSKEL